MAPRFVCTSCGDLRVKFKSQCPGCGLYSTLILITQARSRGIALPIGMRGGARKRQEYLTTGIAGLDAMASSAGGLARGKCYTMIAPPGCGKSTLWLQVAAHVAEHHRAIYAYLEEGEDTAEGLLERLGLPVGRVLGIEAESLEQLFERTAGADLVVLDSLQGLRNRCGTPEEQLADAIGKHSRETGTTFVLISHVNKEGEARGTMEALHWVDAVLWMSGKKGDPLRVLAASKNRVGPTDRMRFLRMTPRGLVDVPDASSFLLADRAPGETGSAVGAVLIQREEGTAVVLVEVQAMVTAVEAKQDGSPARAGRLVCDRVDAGRLRVLLNVLEKIDVSVRGYDVTLIVCGDISVDDRGFDLPVTLAIASAVRGMPLPEICAWGELDLVGRIRPVTAHQMRLEEAQRASFKPVEGTRLRDVIDELLIAPSPQRVPRAVEASQRAKKPPKTSKKTSKKTPAKTPEKTSKKRRGATSS